MSEVIETTVDDTITQIDSEVTEVVATSGENEEVKEVDYDKMEKDSKETLQRLKELEEQNSVYAAQIEADLKEKQTKAFNNALEGANLSSFKGIENLSELSTNKQIEFIQNAVNEILIQHAYKPQDIAQQEAYTEALASGDVEKAIGFKFNKLFGRKG